MATEYVSILVLFYPLLAIAALVVYVFMGGLVVRMWNAMPNTEEIAAGKETTHAAILWPFVIAVIAGITIGMLCSATIRLSQWRPKRKSVLPGARLVKS